MVLDAALFALVTVTWLLALLVAEKHFGLLLGMACLEILTLIGMLSRWASDLYASSWW